MSIPQDYKSPLPTKQQADWVENEIGVIIHLDVQVFEPTYQWREKWGYTPDPSVVNPKDMDTDKWLKTAKKAGAKYAILVAKHCSGFSLWPTKAHDYHIGNSPWKNGKGDLVADFIASCKKFGIKPGIYCSASANAYMEVDNPGIVIGGTEEDNRKYNEMVILQLRELWSNYGPLHEIWFDGGVIPEANGGPPIESLQRELQPDALTLGAPLISNHPIRHGGSENGESVAPAWGTITSKTLEAEKRKPEGEPYGDRYWPIEAIIANRDNTSSSQGGWMWKADQDDSVHPTVTLMSKYYKSVGRNANLLIGMVIDDEGRFPAKDAAVFEEFGEMQKRLASLPRDTTSGNAFILEMDITENEYVSEALLKENFINGENVKSFQIQALINEEWETVYEGLGIGHKRLIEFPKVKTDKIRLNVLESVITPEILEFSVYFRIPIPQPPKIKRDVTGKITITGSKDCKVYYTLDGSMPTEASHLYKEPFTIEESGSICASSIPENGFDPNFPELESPLVTELFFGKVPTNWEVIYADGEYDEFNLKENILTSEESPWISGKNDSYPHEIIVDMKEEQDLSGFLYTPFWNPGHILQYEFYVGMDADKIDTLVSVGSFPDIMNMPTQQLVKFDKTFKARFFKFVPIANATGFKFASIGQLEIIS